MVQIDFSVHDPNQNVSIGSVRYGPNRTKLDGLVRFDVVRIRFGMIQCGFLFLMMVGKIFLIFLISV